MVQATTVASEKHAQDIQILNMRGLSDVADYFIIASASSDRQLRAIADHIMQSLPEKPHHTEGYPSNGWILLDYEDVVIHLFQDDLRLHYDLEGLWCEAPRLNLAQAKPLQFDEASALAVSG